MTTNELDNLVHEAIARKVFDDLGNKNIKAIVLTDVLHWITLNWSKLGKEDELLPGHCYKEARQAWDNSKPYYDDQPEELKEFVRDMVARFGSK